MGKGVVGSFWKLLDCGYSTKCAQPLQISNPESLAVPSGKKTALTQLSFFRRECVKLSSALETICALYAYSKVITTQNINLWYSVGATRDLAPLAFLS